MTLPKIITPPKSLNPFYREFRRWRDETLAELETRAALAAAAAAAAQIAKWERKFEDWAALNGLPQDLIDYSDGLSPGD